MTALCSSRLVEIGNVAAIPHAAEAASVRRERFTPVHATYQAARMP
jgi:hypothetical protein